MADRGLGERPGGPTGPGEQFVLATGWLASAGDIWDLLRPHLSQSVAQQRDHVISRGILPTEDWIAMYQVIPQSSYSSGRSGNYLGHALIWHQGEQPDDLDALLRTPGVFVESWPAALSPPQLRVPVNAYHAIRHEQAYPDAYLQRALSVALHAALQQKPLIFLGDARWFTPDGAMSALMVFLRTAMPWHMRGQLGIQTWTAAPGRALLSPLSPNWIGATELPSASVTEATGAAWLDLDRLQSSTEPAPFCRMFAEVVLQLCESGWSDALNGFSHGLMQFPTEPTRQQLITTFAVAWAAYDPEVIHGLLDHAASEQTEAWREAVRAIPPELLTELPRETRLRASRLGLQLPHRAAARGARPR